MSSLPSSPPSPSSSPLSLLYGPPFSRAFIFAHSALVSFPSSVASLSSPILASPLLAELYSAREGLLIQTHQWKKAIGNSECKEVEESVFHEFCSSLPQILRAEEVIKRISLVLAAVASDRSADERIGRLERKVERMKQEMERMREGQQALPSSSSPFSSPITSSTSDPTPNLVQSTVTTNNKVLPSSLTTQSVPIPPVKVIPSPSGTVWTQLTTKPPSSVSNTSVAKPDESRVDKPKIASSVVPSSHTLKAPPGSPTIAEPPSPRSTKVVQSIQDEKTIKIELSDEDAQAIPDSPASPEPCDSKDISDRPSTSASYPKRKHEGSKSTPMGPPVKRTKPLRPIVNSDNLSDAAPMIAQLLQTLIAESPLRSGHKVEKPRTKPPCIFGCGLIHRPTICSVYSTLESRITRLLELKRCTFCLKKRTIECSSPSHPRMCSYCRLGPHNPLLCPSLLSRRTNHYGK